MTDMPTAPLTTDRTGRFLAYTAPVVTDHRASPDLIARFCAAWERVSGH